MGVFRLAVRCCLTCVVLLCARRWLPSRYVIPVPPKNTCPECRNLYGPDNRVRHCTECDRDVCSLCGESFMVKVKRGQAKSAWICFPCAQPLVKGKGRVADAIDEVASVAEGL